MNSTANETSNATSQGPGQRLRQARECINMHLDDVAKKLRLSRAQVQAIETDDYSYVSALAYARGHLRMYAGLVGISSHEVLKAFDHLGLKEAASTVPPVLQSSRLINCKNKKSFSGLVKGAIFAGILIAGVAVAIFYISHHHKKNAAVNANVATPDSATAAVAPASSSSNAQFTLTPITKTPSSSNEAIPLTLPPNSNNSQSAVSATPKANPTADMPIHRTRPVDQNAQVPQGSDNVRE